MNSLLNILIKVSAGAAKKEVDALRAQIARLEAQMAAASKAGAGASFVSPVWGASLRRNGSQIQWLGRQITYNFAIPLGIAGIAATKWQLDNEKAMTRVSKVYGDGSAAFNKLSQTEIPALGRAFEAMSNRFGIVQKDVINVAADWAAAGASGIALARATELTLKTMILGEMGAVDATDALVAIQAQYGIAVGKSTDKTMNLTKVIDVLNMVENQTGTTMGDLVTAMSKAAGTARNAGIDVQHLAAMTAALVPAAGSAANAGNGLKTIISRLLSPMQDAADLMSEMGLKIDSAAWASKNGTQRLEALATSFQTLTGTQKATVAAYVAGRYQINRFDILMESITNKNGYYQKALAASSDSTKNFAQAQRELNAVLDSSPQKMQRIWVTLQNAMADVIQPLIPTFIMIGATVANLARDFSNLDPRIQQTVVSIAALIIAFGITVKLLGAFMNLLGLFAGTLYYASRPLAIFSSLLTGLAGLGFSAVMGGFTAMSASIIFMTRTLLWNAAAVALFKTEILAGLASMAAGGAAILSRVAKWWGPIWIRSLLLVFAATQGAIGTALTAVNATIQLFLFTTLPSMITGAYATLYTASLRAFIGIRAAMTAVGPLIYNAALYMFVGIRLALAASVPMILATMSYMTYVVQGFMTKMVAPIAIAAGRMWVGIETALVMTMWRIRVLMSTLPMLVGRAMAATLVVIKGFGPLIVGAVQTIAVGIARLAPLVMRAIVSPWGLAIITAVTLVVAFRTQIVQLFWNIVDSVANAFNQLPMAVQRPIMMVVNFIRSAALAVYGWFSYLNPFAHHSPSLVEQVTKGMDVISKQYARASNLGSVFKRAAKDLGDFKKIADKLDSSKAKEDRGSVKSAMPKDLGTYDKLTKDGKALNRELDLMNQMLTAQQKVVDAWKGKLDSADTAIKKQQDKIDGLQTHLDKLTTAYDAHKQALENYASAPIKGMGAMSDAIFENEIAQKKLRLEIMKMEDAGGSIDDVRNKMQALAGDIEALKGDAKDLRLSGAGSDVTGPINDQIDQMQKAYKEMGTAVNNSPITAAQKQLEALQREGEKLDLTNSINFDPLTREIDKLANAQKELSYDEIVTGIKNEQAAMGALQPEIDKYTAALQQQQDILKGMQDERDKIQTKYDAEQKKLESLQATYDSIKTTIDSVTDAIQRMVSASQQIEQAKKSGGGGSGSGSNVLDQFKNGGKGDFAIAGGNAQIGREGGLTDQSKQIDQMAKDMQSEAEKAFKGMDMFKPIKDMWNGTVNWVKANLGPFFSSLGASFQGLGQGISFGDLGTKFENFWNKVESIGKSLKKLFGDDFAKMWDELKKSWDKLVTALAPEIEQFKQMWPGISEALKNFGKLMMIILTPIGIALLAVAKIITSVFANTIGPAIDIVIAIIKTAIGVIRGVIQIIVGIFTGDLGMIIDGVKTIMNSVIQGIISVFKGGIGLIWGVVKGLVEGVVGFFKWLWDVLVGHSIIPDTINAIIEWFKNLFKPVTDAVKKVVDAVIKFFGDMWTGIKNFWNNTIMPGMTAIGKWLLDTGTGFLSFWWNLPGRIAGFFNDIWNKISGFWKATIVPGLTAIGTWLLDTGSGFMSFWWNLPGRIAQIFQGIWTKIGDAWDGIKKRLGEIGAWVVDGKNGFMSWWNRLPDLIKAVYDKIGEKIKSGLNVGIDAINSLISGINKVSGMLHLGFTIDSIPKFETGTNALPTRVGGGFSTSKARAIVGEGSNQYPEFVIPTDPKYRGRAAGLYAQLGKALGAVKNVTGTENDIGLEWAKYSAKEVGGPVGSAGSAVVGLIRGGIAKAAEAALGAATNVIGQIDSPLVSGMVTSLKNKVVDWIKGQDNALPVAGGAAGNTPISGSGWGAIVKLMEKSGVPFRVTSTTGGQHAPGSLHYIGRAVDLAGPSPSELSPSLNAIYKALLPYAGNLAELIYAGGTSYKNGSAFNYGQETLDAHRNHVHAALANGGMVNKPIKALIGEAGPEAVLPLNEFYSKLDTGFASIVAQLRDVEVTLQSIYTEAQQEARAYQAQMARADSVTASPGGGSSVYNFYGDLSFPNVSSGDDADSFIDSLKKLGD